MRRKKLSLWEVAKIITRPTDIMAKSAVVITAVLITLSALMRYVLGRPFAWSDEICSILVVLTCFTGSALAFKEGSQIRVSVLASGLPPRARDVLWIPVCLVSLFTIGYLAWAALKLALDSLAIGSTLWGADIGVFPFQLVMCIGLFSLLVVMFAFTICRMRIAFRSKTEEKDDRKELPYD